MKPPKLVVPELRPAAGLNAGQNVSRDPRVSVTSQRISELDFVKGALVLFMVLYHWINYSIGLDWGGYRYLRFLTPSFIFITGFLISRVSLSKHKKDDSRLRWRLWSRGIRLLVLFTVLNVLAFLVDGRLRLIADSPAVGVDVLTAIFVRGNGRAAFDILVSIGYFLIVAPAVLWLSTQLRVSLGAVAIIVITASVTGSFIGLSNPHLELLSIGLAGLGVGERFAVFVDNPSNRPSRLVLAYLVYLAAITIWNAIFPLQVIGVGLTLLGLSALAPLAARFEKAYHVLLKVGQYSLIAYIAQIAVLHLMRQLYPIAIRQGTGQVVALVVTIAATLAAVEIVDRGRARMRAVDHGYRLVFG